jgi:hypothetical protein
MSGGSLIKYFNDRGGDDSEHRGNLHWPGTSAGVPLRAASAPLLRGEEFENQITHVSDFHSRLFKLWDPTDKHDFDVVMDRIYGGWYAERRRHDRWCEEHMGYIVWLEWLQIYGEPTNGKTITPFR